MSDQTDDAIAPHLLDVLSLFDGPLQKVTFPDVDRATLHDLAKDVRRAADEVKQARALLAAAEGALEVGRRALEARADRALAYARIFAADDAELRDRLDRIAARAPGSPLAAPAAAASGEPAPKKRGRPRKVPAETLFGAPAAPAIADATAAE